MKPAHRIQANVPAGPIDVGQGFHVLIFNEGRHMIAQVLEHDIAVQGRNLKEIDERLAHTIACQIVLDRHANRPPLSTVPRAPDALWKCWQAARPLMPAKATAGHASKTDIVRAAARNAVDRSHFSVA